MAPGEPRPPHVHDKVAQISPPSRQGPIGNGGFGVIHGQDLTNPLRQGNLASTDRMPIAARRDVCWRRSRAARSSDWRAT